MFICIQAMLHGLKKEEPDKEGENDSKQAGKERAKRLHDRYHRFLKGELLELLTEKEPETKGTQGHKPGAKKKGQQKGHSQGKRQLKPKDPLRTRRPTMWLHWFKGAISEKL